MACSEVCSSIFIKKLKYWLVVFWLRPILCRWTCRKQQNFFRCVQPPKWRASIAALKCFLVLQAPLLPTSVTTSSARIPSLALGALRPLSLPLATARSIQTGFGMTVRSRVPARAAVGPLCTRSLGLTHSWKGPDGAGQRQGPELIVQVARLTVPLFSGMDCVRQGHTCGNQ